MNCYLFIGLLLLTACEKKSPEAFSFSLMGRQVIPNSPRSNPAPHIRLVILAGQSNMAAIQRVDRKQIYDELGLDLLHDHLVGCAIPSTSISTWQKGQSSYDNCMAMVEPFLKVGDVPYAIFWWQGENEAQTGIGADTWAREFQSFISSFRNDTHAPTVPVIYARLGNISTTLLPYIQTIRDQQSTLSIPYSTMVNLDEIDPIPADIHYSLDSYQALTHRFTQTFLFSSQH